MNKTDPLFQKYNPRLDGLRAIAVLLVIFTHYQVPGFSNGGYGVDIFFVLSGFLITLVLIKGREKNESLFVFYWRRFLRLMPALFFMCICILIFSLFFGSKVPLETAFQDIFASIFYVSNWTRALLVGIPVIPVMLGNTWSLAIEEQFYLIWPPLFLFLYSRYKIKHVLLLTTMLMLTGIGWSIYAGLHNFGFTRIYNGFDTRSFTLMLGCCLAIFLQIEKSGRFLKVTAKAWPVAVMGMIYLICIMKTSEVNTTYYSLFASILTVIIIISTYYKPESLFGKFLGIKPVVAIGKISYGLYLWHYPVWLILFTFEMSKIAIILVGITLSFFTAAASYLLIEKKLLLFRDSPDLPLKSLGKLTVSISIVGMFVGGIYFLLEPVKAILFHEPIAIQTFSPAEVKVGEAVNVHTDGQSYFVMATMQKLPSDTKLRIDNRENNVFISENIIATPLSRELLNQLGRKEVVLVSAVGGSLAPPVYFEVIENIK